MAYCVDLANTISGNTSYTYEYDATLFTSDVVDNLDRLFTQHYADVVDSVTSAALQVLVWEMVYDTGALDLSSGAFVLNSGGAVATTASAWLSSLTNDSGDYNLVFLESDTDSQDLVTIDPVPVPAAGLLMLAGLGAFGAVAGRRKTA
ncbi:hypothetical protein RGUI_1427 [Rhodovulum sp. P5]|nr:hypothetical protein RGUI_1427 [Rhodovulum sp. P5]